MEEQRKAVWPTTINGQSLSGSTGTMETQLPSIQVSKCPVMFPAVFQIRIHRYVFGPPGAGPVTILQVCKCTDPRIRIRICNKMSRIRKQWFPPVLRIRDVFPDHGYDFFPSQIRLFPSRIRIFSHPQKMVSKL